MADQFYFVVALDSGTWSTKRAMIVALTKGLWNIDGQGVNVVEGVVYSFADYSVADYILSAHINEFPPGDGPPRAVPVSVEKGMIITFAREQDAVEIVASGRARWLTEAEFTAMVSGEGTAGSEEEETVVAAAPASSPEPVVDHPGPVEGARTGRKRRSASA